MELLQAMKTLSQDGKVVTKVKDEAWHEELNNMLQGLGVQYFVFDSPIANELIYELNIEEDTSEPTRTCTKCGEGMHEGYYVEAGIAEEYYCSTGCLEANHEHYNESESNVTAFWTTWED